MNSHLVHSYTITCKTLIVKHRVKRKIQKNKQGNVLNSLLMAIVLFFHRLSDDLILNCRTLAATALSETCNIPIVKQYN